MLIIQGVFRSGTTMLFRALRNDPDLRCYYEPLHPDLLDHVRDSKSERPSHSKSPLYTEFASLPLQPIYDSSFALRYAALGSQDSAPDLKTYLHTLTTSASHVALQFNRGFWMTRWLHHRYPNSTFVHVVRDPRSVVWSQLTTSSGQRARMNLPLLGRSFLSFSSSNLHNVFSQYAYYGAYQIKDYIAIGKQLKEVFQDNVTTWAQARIQATRNALPFVKALALWGAQVRVCHHHARDAFGERYCLIRYKDFCRRPRHTLNYLYKNMNRSIPLTVDRHCEQHIHANRLSHWQEVEQASTHFQTGIQKANINIALHEMGYSI